MIFNITLYDKSNPKEKRNKEMNFDNDDMARWQFEEGNYSCDCNRSIFFFGDEKYNCNANENIMIVEKIVNTETGKIVYNEIPLDC